jgi:hypothetical protein
MLPRRFTAVSSFAVGSANPVGVVRTWRWIPPARLAGYGAGELDAVVRPGVGRISATDVDIVRDLDAQAQFGALAPEPGLRGQIVGALPHEVSALGHVLIEIHQIGAAGEGKCRR